MGTTFISFPIQVTVFVVSLSMEAILHPWLEVSKGLLKLEIALPRIKDV